MWDNWRHTGDKNDKSRFELAWTKKSRANSGKWYRKLVIIWMVDVSSASLPGSEPVKLWPWSRELLFFLQLLQTGDRGDKWISFGGLWSRGFREFCWLMLAAKVNFCSLVSPTIITHNIYEKLLDPWLMIHFSEYMHFEF